MKKLTLIASLVGLLAVSAPAQLQITSLNKNGLLTWTNTFTNGGYSVQWASAVGANTAWQQDWSSLWNLAPTSTTSTVSVPMFYRVSCFTNGLFWPMPLGRMLIFSVSNSMSGVRTQQFQSMGVLSMPSWTNQYSCMVQRDTLGNTNVFFARATDRAIYLPSRGWTGEELRWTNGPAGMSFSFTDSSGPLVTTILSTTATVSVPAGTYNNCLVFSNRCAACSDTTPYFIEYVKPGVGLVYWEDYWGVDNAPDIYRLQSIKNN